MSVPGPSTLVWTKTQAIIPSIGVMLPFGPPVQSCETESHGWSVGCPVWALVAGARRARASIEATLSQPAFRMNEMRCAVCVRVM